jgi:hypothetical protein
MAGLSENSAGKAKGHLPKTILHTMEPLQEQERGGAQRLNETQGRARHWACHVVSKELRHQSFSTLLTLFRVDFKQCHQLNAFGKCSYTRLQPCLVAWS